MGCGNKNETDKEGVNHPPVGKHIHAYLRSRRNHRDILLLNHIRLQLLRNYRLYWTSYGNSCCSPIHNRISSNTKRQVIYR